MIPIKCIECIHCLPPETSWIGKYYPRDCGEGMIIDPDVFCSKNLPEFKTDLNKKLVVDRSSRSYEIQLSLFD